MTNELKSDWAVSILGLQKLKQSDFTLCRVQRLLAKVSGPFVVIVVVHYVNVFRLIAPVCKRLRPLIAASDLTILKSG